MGNGKPAYVAGFKFYEAIAVLSFQAVDMILVSGNASDFSEVQEHCVNVTHNI
jgi:hypothetical protein